MQRCACWDFKTNLILTFICPQKTSKCGPKLDFVLNRKMLNSRNANEQTTVNLNQRPLKFPNEENGGRRFQMWYFRQKNHRRPTSPQITIFCITEITFCFNTADPVLIDPYVLQVYRLNPLVRSNYPPRFKKMWGFPIFGILPSFGTPCTYFYNQQLQIWYTTWIWVVAYQKLTFRTKIARAVDR